MKKRILYTKQLIFGFNLGKEMRLFVLLIFLSHFTVWANNNPQQTIAVKGSVTEAETGMPVVGANIVEQGSGNGVMTDFDGNFTINVPANATLIVSYLGLTTQKIEVNSKTEINVVMDGDVLGLDEVVIVGYGKQKKESVVGSIVQVSGDKLLQSGGVATVGQALTGRLPGVTTISSTGRPGEEAPDIFIRGRSSWNGSGQPLILVDGIERSMNDVNSNDVESISVLKDASATAVFGVKGANGVILITTKRGKLGKAQLSLTASSTFKTPSKLPEKYDSYNGITVANESIERSVPANEGAWSYYVPESIADRYRNPINDTDKYVYPNVDWIDVTQKDFAMDYKVDLSVSGGTEYVKYFGAINYNHVGDIYDGEAFDSGRGYTTNFDYNRFNFRSNIDFDVTKSTRLSVNLSGYYGVQGGTTVDRSLLNNSIYELAPDLFYPLYPDGSYGRAVVNRYDILNPAVSLTARSDINEHRVQVNTDFVLQQKLDFVTEGLSFRGSFSFDNNFRGNEGINDPKIDADDNVVFKIYNDDGTFYYVTPPGENQFDYVVQPWSRDGLNINDDNSSRRLFYQLSFNYDRIFGEKHTVGMLALMNREEYAIGNMFPRYREDWVARATYNYDSRYFIDVNGAYNGSEKYGPGFRFDLFPSVALGWMVTNESFMSGTDSWLNKLKIRGSYGIVGDDSSGGRWGYISQWGSGGSAYLNNSNKWDRSPYTFYKEATIGNPNLQWETSQKANIGFELAVLQNMFTLDVDFFQEDRDNIVIPATDRSVPSFFGFQPPDANLGKTSVKGMELVFNYKQQLTENWSINGDFAYTFTKDEIIYKEDPELRPDYQKEAGYAIGQPREIIRGDLMMNWDDVYGSYPRESNQGARRPGFYDEQDWNMDGFVSGEYDQVPFGYTERPQNTFNLTLGTNYKKFSFTVQLYGVSNATKQYQDRTFVGESHLYFDFLSDYWSKENPDGEHVLSGFNNTQHSTDSYRQWYDASFVKLQNMEFAYTFASKGDSSYRVYLNGNNLAFWSKLPDDRQSNDDGEFRGGYPSFRRINLGVNINF
ncbi:TonB-dependent receptor plug [Cellulophaga algicola DSM 14237]|uniref:TonB-dependent receptor plug n=1 Tax=Cellulophaga algicola (strain DSM 14237 / IC166 / ACAM 630) TaxID=688270 RepID=E6X5I2_CELAD|nr:TonB-dependent receptor plug [Cellulophaga algicola DSM 14237]